MSSSSSFSRACARIFSLSLFRSIQCDMYAHSPTFFSSSTTAAREYYEEATRTYHMLHVCFFFSLNQVMTHRTDIYVAVVAKKQETLLINSCCTCVRVSFD